ncbi:hyoscyamine 6-dioxygenase-like [Gastrolobium bilobum]|uniref:hyoscyamine 6-dioxygenase-like n=1 Tax=Gastrolobium bilobum TaxID=150636 RepID=UPI002AB2E170|nr:hyoscyamine 6-dioxygenase-like [Gastrolobium bilobum]
MEKLISSRCNLQYVPESYILPPESRPGKEAPLCNMVPVIDLGGELCHDNSTLTQQIMKASQEFGFFQLVNHGIPNKLLDDATQVAKEFFELPIEDKARLYSEDPKQGCRLYTSIDYANEDVHYWRDSLKHPCHPLQEHIQNWPNKPTRYQDVMGSYSVKVRKLSLQLLDMICKGLGLESGYFNNELSSVQLMAINHYPPCPDPSLTLGLPKHGDVFLITLLFQGEMNGLQVWKDGQWFAVEPLPNALVVNIGHMLQIISNGKLMSADHRVVTSKGLARTTVGCFILPSHNCHIEPAKALVVGDCVPSLYKSFEFKDFLSTYVADTHARVPPLERYKLQ